MVIEQLPLLEFLGRIKINNTRSLILINNKIVLETKENLLTKGNYEMIYILVQRWKLSIDQ